MSLEGYEEVKERLPRFWGEHEDGRVETTLIEWRDNEFVVRAALYRTQDDPTPAATGLAHERLGGSGANREAALENCETSAIGRALANWVYASADKPRPSREEMRKATSTDWHASLRELLSKVPWPDDFDQDDEDLHQAAGIAAFFDGEVNTVSQLSDAQAQKLATALSPTNTTSGADRRKKFAQFAIDTVNEGSEDGGAGETSPSSDTPPEPTDGDRLWADVQAVWRKLGIQGPRVLTHARMIVSQDDLDDSEGRVEWSDPRDIGPDTHPDVLRGLLSWLEDQQAKAGAA